VVLAVAAAQGWLDIYRRYILLIYIRWFHSKILYFFPIFSIFIEFLKYFLMRHIVTTFWFSVCVLCWLMTCALSIFSVLDNFCQILPLHRNALWMTRVLHLICNAHTHTHILLFGSKFYIILAMYVQMLDIYIENIGYFQYFLYDIFQPCSSHYQITDFLIDWLRRTRLTLFKSFILNTW